MNQVTIYELWSNEKLKFASISSEEARDQAQLIYDSTGVIVEIREYERDPIDHTRKG